MPNNNKYKTPVPIFRETAIGLIPVDWEVKRLGEICSTFKSGNGITSETISESGEYAVYGGNGIRGFTKSFTHEGDFLLIGRQGALCGNIFQISGKNYVSEHAIAVQTNTENYNSYLAYKLDFFNLNRLSESSAQPGLSVEKLIRIKLPIPPLPEQQKIATILSTWDVAINNCKTIIQKLQLRNKGLAQQLLTGKMRAKGFESTKWKYVSINKIAKEISVKNATDKELIVMSCTKYHGLVPSLEYFGRKIYSDDLTTYKIVKKGQFAYATNHIEEGSIGYQSIYEEALISPMYTVFQTNENLNDNLLFRILKSHKYIHEYQRRMEGSIDRRGGLRWDEFSKIKIPILELEEQDAILTILNTATNELTHYQQKLQALQLQKKGLMQQLLTGKVRV